MRVIQSKHVILPLPHHPRRLGAAQRPGGIDLMQKMTVTPQSDCHLCCSQI